MMMSGQPINQAQARALARFIHELRPDWDATGIVHFLAKTRERNASAAEVAHATIRAAMHGPNRSPAVIPLDGPHWQAESEARSSGRPASPDRLCRTCGQEQPRCRQLAQVADDGHEFDPLTGPPPNLDRDTGELLKPPPAVVSQLRALFSVASADTRVRGALPEVPERRLQEPAPATEPPTPTPEPATSTQGDS